MNMDINNKDELLFYVGMRTGMRTDKTKERGEVFTPIWLVE